MRTARSLVHTATHSVSVDKEGKYPQFASEQRRSNTFHGFPLRDEHLLRRLVQIGFFYTGHSDIVICYSCGLSLYQWLQEDDPYIVHARWKPNCQHIRSVLTSAYIDAVQRETATIGSTQ
ncbi:baculoviral IAP repeat-containing protein 7-B-like [Babylonia areolata]|uniref:baculoviral IAP repeat-containing protein 7-B-like n=1 Tax=Babylonia areolata TaxID=304850 RepID=UPI003FCEF6DA